MINPSGNGLFEILFVVSLFSSIFGIGGYAVYSHHKTTQKIMSREEIKELVNKSVLRIIKDGKKVDFNNVLIVKDAIKKLDSASSDDMAILYKVLDNILKLDKGDDDEKD